MLLNAGDAIGPYVVVASAGAGGMGEVYKARDTRLNRVVALKVITHGFGDHPETRRRFAAEARAIAALNHPHICALYDTGHHEGRDFLVLEYLEGETLAQRLRRGAVPVRELLGYAIEIAEALHYAHRRGIIHRDLKPTNVLIARSGGAKLLDFGLAKLRVDPSSSDDLSGLTTQPLPVTTQGAIVGTLHYLAPERLDGHEADARADVFAFGAMFYEMATGRRAFDEKSQARLIAAILSSEPPPIDSAAGLPVEFQWIVQNCLAKNPDERWQSMGDVAKMLKGIARTESSGTAQSTRPMRSWLGMTASALLGAAIMGSAVLFQQSRTPQQATRAPITLSVLPPAGHVFALSESSIKSTQFALAPDGQILVFVAAANGSRQLWLRELGRSEPRPIDGTTGASYPFWSPDSRSIGFFAGDQLKKVGLSGRAPQTVCNVVNGRGGAWRDDGTIVFSPDTTTPLFRVSASAGIPVALTKLAAGHVNHRWPQFLPDGRLLFFVQSGDPNVRGIYLTTLDRPEDVRRIRAAAASATYAAGRLLYVLDGELMAQPLNAATLEPSGEAVPVGLNVSVSSTFQSALSVSPGGVLATWSDTARSELVWVDRGGTRLGTAGSSDRYVDFRLSPDDQRLAVSRVDSAANTTDLAMIELARGGAVTVLTSSPQSDATPIWSADGARLAFRSNRRGVYDLFETPSHGGGDARLLYSSGFGMYPSDWSPDGGSILFHMLGTTTKHDIWSLDLSRRPQPTAEPLLHTSALEAQGQLSRQRRLAYTSDESGRLQVYVRAIDGADGPINVSVNGGFDPRWRADGRELFFISPTGTIMSTEVTTEGQLQVRPPKALFPTPIREPSPPYLSNFVPTSDGRRFLINVPLERPGSQPITVTLNWPSRISPSSR